MNAKLVGSDQPTLVLSHGLGGTQSVWDEVIPSLSRHNRVLLFDWSFSSSVDNHSMVSYDASNYSSLGDFAEDLISLLDGMKLKDVVYVGHSMAGMIGVIASVRRPDLFTHLVLIGASPRYLNAEDNYNGGFDRQHVEEMLTIIRSNFTVWAENFATVAIRANNRADESVKKFCAGFTKMRPETALSLAQIVFFSDFRDLLENIEVRCTIVQGTHDIVVPLSVAHYMKSKMKGKAELEVIESVGHFPQLTCPNVLIDIIHRVVGQRNDKKISHCK